MNKTNHCSVMFQIYPSEFGKERMAGEEKHGPQELTEVKLADDAPEEEDDTELTDGLSKTFVCL